MGLRIVGSWVSNSGMGFKARSTNNAPAQSTAGRKKAGRPAAGAASANKKKAAGRAKKEADKAPSPAQASQSSKKAGGRAAAAPAAASKKQAAAPAAKKKTAAKGRGAGRLAAAASAPAESNGDIRPLHETIRQALVAALERHHSLRQAAKALQMPYSSFRDKLDQLGIEVPGRQRVRHRSRPAFTIKGE